MDEERKLAMEATLGADAVKTVEMITKDLEYHMNLLMKKWQGLQGLTSFNFRSSPVGKTLLESNACYREIISKKSQLTQQTSLFYF